MDRSKLPYRKNCEGYFLYEKITPCNKKHGSKVILASRKPSKGFLDNDQVIVNDTGKGYLEFPGGGVDENEEPEQALLREAYEEAGVIIEGKLKEIGLVHFIWDKDWAKTEKQKQRYKKFRGEEMHFFTGKVKSLVEPKGDSHESGWKGERAMPIDKAIRLIESGKPFSKDIKKYRKFQLNALKELRNNF